MLRPSSVDECSRHRSKLVRLSLRPASSAHTPARGRSNRCAESAAAQPRVSAHEALRVSASAKTRNHAPRHRSLPSRILSTTCARVSAVKSLAPNLLRSSRRACVCARARLRRSLCASELSDRTSYLTGAPERALRLRLTLTHTQCDFKYCCISPPLLLLLLAAAARSRFPRHRPPFISKKSSEAEVRTLCDLSELEILAGRKPSLETELFFYIFILRHFYFLASISI